MKENNQLAKWLNDDMTEQELKTFQAEPDYAIFEKIKTYSATLTTTPFDEQKILTNALASPKRTVIPIRSGYNWLFRVAAVLVVFLGIFIAWNTFSATTVEAFNGERKTIELPDQSDVILNSGSSIVYKKWNWQNNRRLQLKGEAFFKVQKGSTFDVATSLGNVTVLGTQFNVKERANRFEVTCYEGKVKVTYKHQEKVITKGMSVAFEKGINIGMPNKTNTSPEWLQDEIVFYQEDLNAILQELERQYNTTIVLENFVAKEKFSGTVPSKNIETALKLITTTYHLNLIKQDNRYLLVSSK